MEMEEGVRSVAVPGIRASVGADVGEVAAGDYSTMRVAVCSEAMSLPMVLSETRRKKMHGTAWRPFARGL